MNIVLLGIQGSGKGTQAKILAPKYNLQIFEAGAQCRRLAREDSELGRKVKPIVESGNLIPSQILIEILDEFIAKLGPDQGFILDGMPRSIDQKGFFDQLMKKWNRDFVVLNLQLPQEETLKRLMARGRHDDTPEIINNRLKIFFNDTKPVLDIYQNEGKIIVINAHQEIEKVAQDIDNQLAQKHLTA